MFHDLCALAFCRSLLLNVSPLCPALCAHALSHHRCLLLSAPLLPPGDCWFLSALSVVAERPELIAHLFLTPELNDTGAVQVRFCKNGAWVTVVVDECLPVWAAPRLGGGGGGGPGGRPGSLAFSHAGGPGKALWVSLLEKAYAKLNGGSFASIESGSVFEALAELTGAPAQRVDLHPEGMSVYGPLWGAAQRGQASLQEALWSTLLSARASGFLVGASCGRKDAAPATFQQVGLRSDHVSAGEKQRQRHCCASAIAIAGPSLSLRKHRISQ